MGRGVLVVVADGRESPIGKLGLWQLLNVDQLADLREKLGRELGLAFHLHADAAWGGFEGSKPGAAAAGVWMSHKVLPLNASGYGRLVGETAKGAMARYRSIASGDWAPFKLVPLPPSDLNIVCFAVGHSALETLERTNDFMDRLYRALSVGPNTLKRPDYYVTKTVLRSCEYGRAALPTVEGLGFTSADYDRAGGVAVLRCTVMDPFLASRRGKVDYIRGFVRTLGEVRRAELEVARR